MLALILGTLLAVGALAFVLHPLFFPVEERRRRMRVRREQDSAITALREIEFDRATGKLSDSDYAELRAMYGERALDEIRARTAAPPAPSAAVDPIEARVLAYRRSRRECSTCGLRPEPDAIYCSTCGSYLEQQCPQCSAAIVETSPSFCSSCGAVLASRAPATR